MGEKAQAIAMLKRLLAATPGSDVWQVLTPALLRIDPFGDPLRRDPDFQTLLAQYPIRPVNVDQKALFAGADPDN